MCVSNAYTQSERKQVQVHEVRLKLRVSESKGIVYFYFAEQKQFQAHEVRLKLRVSDGIFCLANEFCKFFDALQEKSDVQAAGVFYYLCAPITTTDKVA